MVEVLRDHLAEHVGPGTLVFSRPTGAPIRRGSFNKLVRWKVTVEQLGLDGVRFHDLRHSGNTLAARSGVSIRDLMARMGHDSVRAAILYQHATTEADARIAAALDAELTGDDDQAAGESGPDDDDDGPAGAVVPTGR